MAILAISMTGCASGTISGTDVGCTIYDEHRATMPGRDVFVQAPLPLAEWIGELDADMTGGCTK